MPLATSTGTLEAPVMMYCTELRSAPSTGTPSSADSTVGTEKMLLAR